MSEIVIYNSPDNLSQIEVTFENETVWLNARTTRSVVSKRPIGYFKAYSKCI